MSIFVISCSLYMQQQHSYDVDLLSLRWLVMSGFQYGTQEQQEEWSKTKFHSRQKYRGPRQSQRLGNRHAGFQKSDNHPESGSNTLESSLPTFEYISTIWQEHLSWSPLFTYVRLDVFAPWSVVTWRTRGGVAQSKRWAILYTFMCTRAVHIELNESMDSTRWVIALSRFFLQQSSWKQTKGQTLSEPVLLEQALSLGRTCLSAVGGPGQCVLSMMEKVYLHTLQPRCRCCTKTQNLQVGDVLLKEGQSPRNKWPMGPITATLLSSDEKVKKRLK